MELKYSLTQSVLPLDSSCTLDLLLSFRAADHPGQQRRSLSMSMVIDKSGSMKGKPIQHATRAAELLVRQLAPYDALSVVAYHHNVETVVPSGPAVNHDPIIKKIRKIKASGSTNLHGGWMQGCEQTLGYDAGQPIRRVLLLTDGQANVGITEPNKLKQIAAEQAEKGIATTTLGFGSGFNEDLLIGIAEAGKGNFYYIETPEDAAQVFLIEGESLTAMVGRELNVTLKPAPKSGVQLVEVLNRLPSKLAEDGSMHIVAGDVYRGEDKLIAIQIIVPSQNTPNPALPLIEIAYSYESAAQNQAGPKEGRALVALPVGADKTIVASVDPDELRAVNRIRVARAKELAVQRLDASQNKQAASILRSEAARLQEQGFAEEWELAEEASQLDFFADNLESGSFPMLHRKALRDQAYQGRSRNRPDLNARGSSGGSAKSLPALDSAEGKTELVCFREGAKLKVHAPASGYNPHLDVLLPRAVREEGGRYAADALELSKTGSFYRVSGQLYRLKEHTKPALQMAETPALAHADPLALKELFSGAEEWLRVVQPVLQSIPDAASFIGPNRAKNIVPVRELTFQALKPNPPAKWNVVIIGQNPYPRIESATGIAMFDNTFSDWKDSQFGKVTSIRCIIKAAAMHKHKIPKSTPIADIRALLAKNKAVQPPEWFQAMLTQGVLLMNAALTSSSDGSRADAVEIARHTAFWKPVIEAILEEILKSKQTADSHHKGIVFAWWGAHAKSLRKIVEKLQKKYPNVPVRHIDHPNPAAQGDIFCDNDHFGAVNEALQSLGMAPIDWLPSLGWNQSGEVGHHAADAGRMGDFIQKTMELHKFYLERLQEVKDEAKLELAPITGILDLPVLAFSEAILPVLNLVPDLEIQARRSVDYSQAKIAARTHLGLSMHEIAAVYLYTCESSFYRQLNLALRDPDRNKVHAYAPYLRLLLSALGKLPLYPDLLWRGVAMDLRKQYPKDATITWWGVSSCTAKLSVAHAFLGISGKRTLFEVRPAQAVGIKSFSAFTGEDEYLLAPGSRLKVVDVKAEKSGLYTITLEELPEGRLVS